LSDPIRVMRRAGIGVILTLLAAASLEAQEALPQQPERLYISRADLTSLLDYYDKSAASPAYGPRLKERAEFEGQQVRTRLEQGDYQVGDRIVLSVYGQQALTDTFTVESGQVIRLPELGDVELQGVLRSELEPKIDSFVARYLRQPRVASRSLMRLQCEGSVARPGFFTMPSETPLPDAVMQGCQPSGNVKLDNIQVTRQGRRLLSGEVLQNALANGRTLDELGLKQGDRIVVPQGHPLGNAESAVRTFGYLLAIPLTLAAVLALF
jgi:hypothetical protein